MNILEAAQTVLHMAPVRFTDGGFVKPSTAYYEDVPFTALPAQCLLKPTDSGFNVSGSLDNCLFSGQLVQGSDPLAFRRVILSFSQSHPSQVRFQ